MSRSTPRAHLLLRPFRSRRPRIAAAAVLLTAAGAAVVAGTAWGRGTRTSASRPVTVKLRASTFHRKILVDRTGRTLYMFTRDRGGKSRCYGACAKVWPPLLAKHGARAVGGVRAKLLGRTKRKDGAIQLTYRHHPLYLFARDRKAGQINGQRRHAFGGHWFVLSPAGTVIKTSATVMRPVKNAAVKISTRVVKGLGPILVNGKGMTLYMFVPDKDKKVTCVATCAALWPPVFLPRGDKISTSVAVTGKAKASLLGVDPSPAGGNVITYKGWPLYLYVADTKPGMTTGQALNLNGGLWYVLNPEGKVIHKKVRIST